MSTSVTQVDEHLHVITRRNYAEDLRRHFVGRVTAYSGMLVRMMGYTFVIEPGAEEYRRKPEKRTRIFGLSDASHIINVLPPDLLLDELRYELRDGRLFFTDGQRFWLDLTEFQPARR